MDDFEKALAEAIEADGGELSEVKDQDGNILKKGDIVGFKAGMEQEGKIVKISGKQITVKSLDSEGFSGGYAAGQEYYDVMADDCWKEESVEPGVEPIEEAKGRTWSANGYLEIKTFDALTSKDVGAIRNYVKRWADGGDRSGPSFLPNGKRWRATDVRLLGGKLMIAFETDGEPNRITFQNIGNEVIGKDGTGGMLWQFGVKDASAPDNLEWRLYGGNWNADDPMHPLRVVNLDIQPNVGFGEEKVMVHNPFGHALHEDAEAQLASVLGKDGAKRVFESMDVRLPIEDGESIHEPIDEGIETGARYEIINYQPGDFGGMEKSFGQFSVSVSGNTFPIKDDLKKLGLRFNPKSKTWDLVHRYTGWGQLAKGSVKRDVVEKAIPKVKGLVDDFNERVKGQNQQSLAGMGISDDPKPADLKGQIKQIMSLQRTNERLKKLGIAIAYDFPESIGGFHNAGSYTAWVVGDTFKVKDQLSKFGFRFNRMVPSKVKDQAKGLKVQAGWSMDGATFDRIDKQVKQTLIRASEGTL